LALDSSLWIDADETPHGIYRTLSKLEGLSPSPDGRTHRLITDGAAITASAPAFADGVLLDFGIDPHLRVWFTCLDKAQSAQWTLATVRCVAHLLDAYPKSDALFLYSSDTPALLRRSGRTTLYRTAGLWAPAVVPQVLPLIAPGYHWADYDGQR
jgi:hypothetical protein